MKKQLVRYILLTLVLLQQFGYAVSQVPTHIDGKKPVAVPFTLPNILIFIVIPLGLLVFYIWWLKQNKKKQAEAEQRKEDK
ncbi:MAG: hypothetical protein WD052_08020 [Bacteroidales bacterium]